VAQSKGPILGSFLKMGSQSDGGLANQIKRIGEGLFYGEKIRGRKKEKINLGDLFWLEQVFALEAKEDNQDKK